MTTRPVLSATPLPKIPLDANSPQVLHELRISKDAEEWLRTFSPGIFENYEQIQKTWNAPLTQFSLTLVQDTQLKSAVQEIVTSHRTNQFLAFEAVLILAIWILRAWRLSKVSTWLTRIWTQVWVGAVYWLCAVFLIPGLVWGAAYRTVLSQLTRAVILHFFA